MFAEPALSEDWHRQGSERVLTGMTAYSIRGLGPFMSKLLSTPCFDSFLMEEAHISKSTTITIDGHLNQDFYSKAEWDDRQLRPYDLIPWSEARLTCRDLIKGQKAPSQFRLVLQLKPEYVPATLSEEDSAGRGLSDAVGALLVNIRLDSSGLKLVTGVSMKSFTLDRSADAVWDKTVGRFLSAKGIEYDEET